MTGQLIAMGQWPVGGNQPVPETQISATTNDACGAVFIAWVRRRPFSPDISKHLKGAKN